jgi:hypothetical protein
MKSILRYGVLAGLGIFLAGCAVPQQSRVTPPDSAVVSAQSSQDSSAGQVSVSDKASLSDSPEIGGNDGTVIEKDIEINPLSMTYVNDRIFEYGRKLDRWKELDSQAADREVSQQEVEGMVQCFRRLQDILNGYSSLRSAMVQAGGVSALQQTGDESILTLQKNDIDFLEGGCGRLLDDPDSRGIGWNRREEGAGLTQLETLIDRYGENEEYAEVVRVFTQIPEDQVGRIQLRTRILYGNALIYLHQEKKAAEVYRQIVDQMSVSKEQATDIVSLRKVLGDIYTASGDYRGAEIQYKKVTADYLNIGRLQEWSKLQLSLLRQSAGSSAELTAYSSILRNYLRFRPDVDGFKVARQAEQFLTDYPYSPVVSNVRYIKLAAMDGANFWFNKMMAEADKLKAEKKFEESVELLEAVPPEILDNEKQVEVEKKNQEVLLAKDVEKETEQMEISQELQRQWNGGMLLVNDGHYDDALAVFSELLNTDYSTKAEQKIREVSLQAAKADRRRAADLFIRSTKTSDLGSKKRLLLESRKLLNSILTKYPDVEIGAKVVGNIARVEQEMLAIDPNMLLLSDQVDSADGKEYSYGRNGSKTAGSMNLTPPVESNPDSVRP